MFAGSTTHFVLYMDKGLQCFQHLVGGGGEVRGGWGLALELSLAKCALCRWRVSVSGGEQPRFTFLVLSPRQTLILIGKNKLASRRKDEQKQSFVRQCPPKTKMELKVPPTEKTARLKIPLQTLLHNGPTVF